MNNNIVYGLYSVGGFGREVMPIFSDYVNTITQSEPDATHSIYFIDANVSAREVNGWPVVSEDEFFGIDASKRYFNVAIADSKIRERLTRTCIERRAIPMSVQSPRATMYDGNKIGEGAILCVNTVITSNAKIGKSFHLNLFSYVAHDCVIGDYVTFAPNVHCNGNVHIHDHAYIGTGALLKQGTSTKPLIIGEGAIVGMGAVVTKDVPPFTTVVGNPARVHIKG